VKFGLVIFDNDGVLVDSEPIACDVLARLLTGYGVPTTYEDVIREFLGGSITRTREITETRTGRKLPPDFEGRFHSGIFERYEKELKPSPDVELVLDYLDSADTPYCVASSGTHERIHHSLDLTGLLERFDGRIFSASDVQHGKPAPDLFLLAARQMGIAPERCVVIEDSPLGIEAAGRAGMASIGFAALQAAEKLGTPSLGTVGSMSELTDLLG
jgi:HAD superfamily hydrolase (TIGR01509 family)